MARVLIVDDTPEVASMLAMYLEGQGHQVTAAGDAREIAALLAKHRPEIIILDYLMPVVNGAQALGRIRATPGAEKTPIIFLSGAPGYRLKVAVASSATERFLHKPVDLPRLKELIGAMLGGSPAS